MPMTEKQRRATKDYFQALANLSDRYLFENMSNKEYVEQRSSIETNYLKTIYKKEEWKELHGSSVRTVKSAEIRR